MNKEEMTWRIRVYGIVQGVGFRPTVSRHATTHGIRGTVCNKGPYVEIFAQGTKEQIDGFLNELKEHPPKRSISSKVRKQRERYSFPRILQSVKNVKKRCLIRKTDDICIHLSTVPAADRDLRFWIHCHTTGNVQV